MVVAGKEGISILTCETTCGALRRGLVCLYALKLEDPTVVIERVNGAHLKPYQTPPPVVCPSCPLWASCSRSPSSVPFVSRTVVKPSVINMRAH